MLPCNQVLTTAIMQLCMHINSSCVYIHSQIAWLFAIQLGITDRMLLYLQLVDKGPIPHSQPLHIQTSNVSSYYVINWLYWLLTTECQALPAGLHDIATYGYVPLSSTLLYCIDPNYRKYGNCWKQYNSQVYEHNGLILSFNQLNSISTAVYAVSCFLIVTPCYIINTQLARHAWNNCAGF